MAKEPPETTGPMQGRHSSLKKKRKEKEKKHTSMQEASQTTNLKSPYINRALIA